MPSMAIEEARKIRDVVTASRPSRSNGSASSSAAGAGEGMGS